MAKYKRIGECYGMKVFTEGGYFYGEVDEAIIKDNRIDSWRVKALPGSALSKQIGTAKGINIPHRMVRAFGDIIIIQDVEIGGRTSKEEPIKENF